MDYTLRAGKDQVIERNRHRMEEAQHDAANAFVKANQNAMKPMGGKAPELKAESMEFSSYMCNNGPRAQELGRKLTVGLDKKAFPVK